MMKRVLLILTLTITATVSAFSAYMLIPMDLDQRNHLKAYGIAYWILEQDIETWWLLNYRGGSFVFE